MSACAIFNCMSCMSLSKAVFGEAMSSPANFPNYDARTGLGYGTQSGLHNPRQYPGTYPYIQPDPYSVDNAEDEDNEDSEMEDPDANARFHKKLSTHMQRVDPYAVKGTNPFYFVGSATMLARESIGPNRTRGSIVAKKGLYRGLDGAMSSGVSQSIVTKPIVHHGAIPQGTEHAPKPLDPSDEEIEDPAISKVRELVRAIFASNLKR